MSLKEGIYSPLSLRTHVSVFFVSGINKKIHKSHIETEILNIPRALYISHVNLQALVIIYGKALLWLEYTLFHFLCKIAHACRLFPCLCKYTLYNVFTLVLVIFNICSVGAAFLRITEWLGLEKTLKPTQFQFNAVGRAATTSSEPHPTWS